MTGVSDARIHLDEALKPCPFCAIDIEEACPMETAESTYYDQRGNRSCRICRAAHAQKYREQRA